MDNNSIQGKQRYDRVINSLFLSLFFIAPLSRAGINIIAPLLTIVWLIKKIKFRQDPDEKFTYPEILKGIGLLGVAILLSLLNAENLSAAFKNIVDEYILLGMIFIVSLDVIKTEKQVESLLKTGLISALLVNLYGIYQHYGLGQPRINSSFTVATQTGVYFTGVVLLAFACLLFRKTDRRLTLIGTFLFFSLNLLCVFLTGTRAAWLGFIAGVALLLIFAFKIKKQVSLKMIVAVFVILILVATFVDLGWVFDRMASIIDLTNSSNRQRIMMYLGGIKMFRDHPLIGVGIGQFSTVYADYLMEGADIYTHIHCFYLHLLVELGLIGFVVFLALVYKILKTGITAYSDRLEAKNWFYYGVLGALLGIGVCNIFDWTFLNLQVGTFTLIMVALWLNQLKTSSSWVSDPAI